MTNPRETGLPDHMKMTYGRGMARKQVVQLDDRLVAELDKAAKEDGVSRSELLRSAAVALLEARRVKRLERRLVEAYTEMPQDPVVIEAARKLAAETAPDW
jgi:metal-responsive CopG/Arc/MetJ family transcriptional regulator